MARKITVRPERSQTRLNSPPDGQVYDRLEYMVQPDGMFATAQPQDAGPNTAIIAKNFLLNENAKLQVRRPHNRVFFDGAVIPIGIIGLTDDTGTGTLYLFHNGGIKWSVDGGTNWTDATGPALSAGPTIVLVNYAMWASTTMLFTTDSGSKVYTYNTATNVYSEIATSPVSQILTVFGGRAVVSNGTSSTVTWSVKNDQTDWTGLGSGFEPLRLSPGSSSDNVIGMFPINDTQMLIVRTGSVWIAELTGNADVPFAFNFLYKVNLTSARSLSYSSEGVYAWGLDDVWLLKPGAPEAIGGPILGGWINSDFVVYNQYLTVGNYEPLKDIYYAYVPFTSADNIQQFLRLTDSGVQADHRITDSGEERIADYPLTDPTLVLAYHRRWKKWTYLSVNVSMYSLNSVNFRTPSIKGLIYTTFHHQAFVEYRTDQILPNDGQDEYDRDNVLQPIEAQIVTGALRNSDNSTSVRIRKMEVDLMTGAVVCQNRRTQMLLYQSRSGPRETPGSAITYSDKSGIADSDGRILHEVRKEKDTKKFWQLDLRLYGCGTYTLLGIYPYVEKKSEINP